MKLVDVRHIAGTPDVVWAALFDTGLLQRCIPGCERFSGDPEAGFDVVVVQGVGPVSARFAGRVVVSQVVDGVSLRIDSEGQGGVAGFAKGGADVSLAAEGDEPTDRFPVRFIRKRFIFGRLPFGQFHSVRRKNVTGNL